MSYPPRNAKRPSELGTSAPAKRQVIDRRADPNAAPTSLSTTDRTNRAIHTHIATADALWEVVAQAAKAASDDPSTCASKILWQHLDPPLAGKSAAVKAAVQALCLGQLLKPSKKLPARLVEWFALAHEVAVGAHALFAQGVRGWDEGLDPDTNKVVRDKHGNPVVSKMAYWPFETYDRTLENPLYARCFGDSEAQSQRSRVKLVDAAKPWRAAESAHRRMLDMEAHHELFLPRDDSANGLTVAELGGLFLLTNLSDNWAKRTELFDLDFWTLRIVHFGLERNLGLRMNQFCLDTLARASAHASPNTAPEPFLRHSFPDPMRSRCWLENVLHCIVALKVHLFLKLRWAAYNDAKGEQVLNEQVLLDRHDIEQSKAHWLPSARPKSNETSPLSKAIPMSEIPPLPLPPPAVPVVAPSSGAPPALHEALLQRLCEHGSPVSGREALAMLASERFLLLKRIEALDRMVGMHMEVHRLLEQEGQAQSATAMKKLAALTAAMDAPNVPAPEATRLAAAFEVISESFTLKASADAALEGVRRRVQARGMQLRAADSVWAMHADREAVAKLAAVGVARATDTHTALGPGEEFDALFGINHNGSLSAARCNPNDGWCRAEAFALLERLVHVLASEAALQKRLRSLDVLVPVPLACCPEVALAKLDLGLPQRSLQKSLRLYANLHKKQTERGSSLNIMAKTCATAMSKAIERAFSTCLAECSDPAESDVEVGDADEQLKMPDRLYACQRKVASAVVHSFLNVAHLYGGLCVVYDDDLPDEDDLCPPIIVYNATAAQLSMPNPMAIVERHWPAAQHLIDLAVSIESWIRDRRRRLPCLLAPEEHLVTLRAEAGLCVHETHRAAALERLESAEDAQRQRYWPAWPPLEEDLVTAERLETALKWGRHATLHALRSTAPRLVLPPEPYRTVPPARVAGCHAWLHRAHLKCAPLLVAVETVIDEDEEDEEEWSR
jgi:hypothetical protein